MQPEIWIPVAGIFVALLIMKLFSWRTYALPVTLIVVVSCGFFVLSKNDPLLLQTLFEKVLIFLSTAFAFVTGRPGPAH